ncbi:hypothetical protein J40TS1_12310 [Paenibacillus montaniterrae]|uniref:DUF4367 domain-containing protein n=1 Tax=Paenibacillus montaniterrae TaxID=429341 RepID=A0A919YNX9_9BACL|nr:DUF4367 domain-containing protein [Paenibacillus montaniterrae]GIP15589.1 hypothetical protein J40TS1_12310 [Paenibacillus montaniterrae]
MENEKYEKLLHDLQQDIEVPDSTPSWNALQPKLERRKRRKRLIRRMKTVTGLVCASLIVSVLIGGGPQRTYAYISEFFNDVIQIFLQKSADDPASALTVPPPAFEENQSGSGDAELAKPEKVTLEEAKQKLAFPLLLPSYVPEQLELSDIRIFKDTDGQFRAAYLEYANAAGALVKVNQRLITNNSSIMMEVQEGAGTIKDVMIGEQYPGILVELSDGSVFMEWIASDIKMLLSGPLTETEALQWAEAFH